MKKYDNNWWRLLVLGIVLIAAWKLLDFRTLFSWLESVVVIMMPFIIGAVLAFLLVRPTKYIESFLIKKIKKIPPKTARLISVITVYILLFAIVAAILKFLIPAVYRNIQELITNMPKYYGTVNEYLNKINASASFNVWDKIRNVLEGYMNLDMMGKLVSAVGSVASALVSTFLSVILSIYILLERDGLSRFSKNFLGIFLKGKKAHILGFYAKKLFDLFYSYFAGLLVDAVIIGGASTIFFYIFGAPYPLLLGLVVAIGNMIPFFGPIVSAVTVYLATALSIGPLPAIWVLVFQLVLGQLDGNLIQPKIIGNSVGISPFWVILAVTLFGGFWGPVGMILGVPIVAAMRILYKDYTEDRKLGEHPAQ